VTPRTAAHRASIATSSLLAALVASTRVAAPADDWRSYAVYQPTVTHHAVIDGRTHPHKYNHCATVAWFQDRWFCLWGSNTHPNEHAPGQRLCFSTSRDGRSWSPVEELFANAAYCANPVPYPEGKGHQWQPNLGVVDGELWAVWNQGGSARDFETPQGTTTDLRGLYFSRLRQAGGKWLNRQLTWDGQCWPTVEGQQFFIASTQNLYRLRSGRVLAPVTLSATAGRAADAPEAVQDWWAREKRNAVLYTDDLGETWHLSAGCLTPGFSWIQWEPTVWEQPDGSVGMFARNNTNWSLGHPKPTSGQYLLSSVSHDRGETWTPPRYAPLESVCSRMHVAPLDGRGVWAPTSPGEDFTGRRYVMVHNDAPGALYSWTRARHNAALFFTRGGGFDFVAGNTVTFDEPEVAYPQMWRHDDTLAVCYTQGNGSPRSIRVALVTPLPEPDRYYLFPRSNDVAPGERPQRVGDAWSFQGGQHLATRAPVDPGTAGFSFGAWVQAQRGGVLFDTRSEAPGGFVVMLGSKPGGGGKPGCLYPLACLLTEPHVFGADLPLEVGGQWHYVGLTADNRTGEGVFHVDGKTASIAFKAPTPHPLKGATAHLGAKRLAASQVAGIEGCVRFAALYAGARFSPAEHHWLSNQFAQELGRPKLDPATAPTASPLVWLDAADAAAFKRDFVLPSSTPRGGSEVVTVDDRRVLRLRDQGSVGVDLDENARTRGDRVLLRFRSRLERGEGQTLCTVGDFNQPARLIARGGQVFLRAGATERPCGRLAPGGWTDVSLETERETTTARVGEGEPVQVQHRPEGAWVYLGEGFPEYGQYPGTSFLVDVASGGTRVVRGAP